MLLIYVENKIDLLLLIVYDALLLLMLLPNLLLYRNY